MTYITNVRGTLSTDNSSTSTLTGDASFTGTGEEVVLYSNLTVCVYSDKGSAAGGLSMQFSTDNTNWDITINKTIDNSKSVFFVIPIAARYFRIVYTNGSELQSVFRLQTLYHNFKQNDIPSDTNISNALTSSFGEQITSNLIPLVELDFIYGINNIFVSSITSQTGATITHAHSHAVLTTGTSSTGLVQITSNRIANYRPGQGIDVRFTCVFDTGGVAESSQIIGIGNEDNGFFFGYNGTDFGVLHRTSGIREIRVLTLTSVASSTTTVTVQLNGATSSDITVTTGLTIAENAEEIANFDFSALGGGWESIASGNEIIFISYLAETRGGSYTFSPGSSGITGSFSTTTTGTSPTDIWVQQTDWNIDRADGNGNLQLLDTTKGNVYRIRFQWLGYGAITYSMEDTITGLFRDVHIIKYSNLNTTVSIANPKMPLFIQIKNSGNTSSLVMRTPSMTALLAGKQPNAPLVDTHSIFSDTTIGNISTLRTLLILRNDIVFKSVINTINTEIVSITFSNNNDKSTLFTIRKNTITDSSVIWTNVDANTTLISYYSNTTTDPLTSTTGSEIFSTILGPKTSMILSRDEINTIIRPCDTLTFGARKLGGSGGTDAINVSVVWYDDF